MPVSSFFAHKSTTYNAEITAKKYLSVNNSFHLCPNFHFDQHLLTYNYCQSVMDKDNSNFSNDFLLQIPELKISLADVDCSDAESSSYL